MEQKVIYNEDGEEWRLEISFEHIQKKIFGLIKNI